MRFSVVLYQSQLVCIEYTYKDGKRPSGEVVIVDGQSRSHSTALTHRRRRTSFFELTARPGILFYASRTMGDRKLALCTRAGVKGLTMREVRVTAPDVLCGSDESLSRGEE